jgi:hypothetical protein
MRKQEELYGTTVFIAEKFDELDAILMQYDMLAGKLIEKGGIAKCERDAC